MKRTENGWGNKVGHALDRGRNNGKFGHAIARTKELLLNEYAHLAEEHARVLKLALNEAEALAWQTEFPQLFFPALATEKVQAAVAWHQRQRAIRWAEGEVAFAE